jgi:hypothetical protein
MALAKIGAVREFLINLYANGSVGHMGRRRALNETVNAGSLRQVLHHLAVALVDVAGCFHNFIIAARGAFSLRKRMLRPSSFGVNSTTVFRSSW